MTVLGLNLKEVMETEGKLKQRSVSFEILVGTTAGNGGEGGEGVT